MGRLRWQPRRQRLETRQTIRTATARPILQRRSQAGVHDDASATARWTGDLRVVSSHANGTQMVTDMPTELGGTGDRVTPGWLFRAGLASCFATRIAMQAAAQGIALTALEVRTSSSSDTRGLLGMCGSDGERVGAGPIGVDLASRADRGTRRRTGRAATPGRAKLLLFADVGRAARCGARQPGNRGGR